MSAESPPRKADTWSAIHAPDDVARAAQRLATYGNSPAELAAREKFLERLHLSPGQHVLDVGAGSGILALELAARVAPGGKVVALDPSKELLALLLEAARAREMGALVETCAADARAIPLADESFDRALCHWVLLHVEHPTKVIAEMMRVVRPGGLVMCVEVDWDTSIAHPGDREITRRILRASCDRHIDGCTGRALLPWFRRLGLENVECLPIVDFDDGSQGDAWREYLRERASLARTAGAVTDAEARAWCDAIDDGYHAKTAFFSFTQFAVYGRVPAK